MQCTCAVQQSRSPGERGITAGDPASEEPVADAPAERDPNEEMRFLGFSSDVRCSVRVSLDAEETRHAHTGASVIDQLAYASTETPPGASRSQTAAQRDDPRTCSLLHVCSYRPRSNSRCGCRNEASRQRICSVVLPCWPNRRHLMLVNARKVSRTSHGRISQLAPAGTSQPSRFVLGRPESHLDRTSAPDSKFSVASRRSLL